MLLFPFKSMCKGIFFIVILSTIVNEIELAFSSTTISRGRSQSMTIPSRNSAIKPIVRTQPEPISSSSSTTSINSANGVKNKPIASTSAFKEVDLETPLVEKTKRVSFISDVNLREASEQTHSEHLIPSRDGVRARIRRILIRYGAPVAVGAVVGSAVGVGAFEFFNTSTTSTTTEKSVNSPQHIDFESN